MTFHHDPGRAGGKLMLDSGTMASRPKLALGTNLVKSAIAPRQNDGFVVPHQRVNQFEVDGGTVSSISIEISAAPAPERRYVADLYGVHHSKEGWRLLFGQQKLGSMSLRSLLILSMSKRAVYGLLEHARNLSHPSLTELAARVGAEAESPTTIDQEPEQTLPLRANLVTVAASDEDAAMDFYSISPFSMHAVNQGGSAQLTPVVRVELRTGQVIGLLQEIDRLMPTWPGLEESK